VVAIEQVAKTNTTTTHIGENLANSATTLPTSLSLPDTRVGRLREGADVPGEYAVVAQTLGQTSPRDGGSKIDSVDRVLPWRLLVGGWLLRSFLDIDDWFA
jgi:hypothetical protein